MVELPEVVALVTADSDPVIIEEWTLPSLSVERVRVEV